MAGKELGTRKGFKDTVKLDKQNYNNHHDRTTFIITLQVLYYSNNQEINTSMDSSKSKQSENNGGTIALLNLQPYTALCLDGSASQTLKNEENLLVINNITPLHGFHLLVVRANNHYGGNNEGGGLKRGYDGASMLSIGLLILYPNEFNNKEEWFIAREFNSQTEEISSRLLDDVSFKNLKQSVKNQDGNVNTLKIISYDRFLNCNYIHGQSPSCNKNEVWEKYLTNFISIEVLSMHGLSGKGDKIVPGSFSQDDDSISTNGKAQENDGITLSYPPMPHIDRNQHRSINAHAGTRGFLASLPPAERTSFFISNNQLGASDKQDISSLIFEKVLSRYYKGSWHMMLGQFQLSFILFLCCSCLSSLEHW